MTHALTTSSAPSNWLQSGRHHKHAAPVGHRAVLLLLAHLLLVPLLAITDGTARGVEWLMSSMSRPSPLVVVVGVLAMTASVVPW